MQKGKLLFKLVTAEEKGQNKALISLYGVLFVLLCFAFFVFGSKSLFDSTYNVYNKDENAMFYILFFVLLFAVSFFMVWVFNAKKKGDAAKLYIYENCVEGTAITQSSGFNGSLENFCLSYNDIFNISSMDRFVIIYTQWQTYKILAFNKHNEIIRIINMQKEISQQAHNSDDVILPCVNDEETKPQEIIPEDCWKCMGCGEYISSEPCIFCSQETTPQEIIPENHWKCMGCGEILPNDKSECECGFKKKYL